MGYRSDVRIITSKKGFKELEKYVTKYLKGNDDYNLLHQLDIDNSNDYERYFGWNSVKWYENSDGFEDVDAVMNGLQDLEEKDLSYRYARIGESYDDYEEKSYESDNEKEQDLDYPYMNREFADEDLAQQLKRAQDKDNEL
jgi:hypothetical protein